MANFHAMFRRMYANALTRGASRGTSPRDTFGQRYDPCPDCFRQFFHRFTMTAAGHRQRRLLGRESCRRLPRPRLRLMAQNRIQSGHPLRHPVGDFANFHCFSQNVRTTPGVLFGASIGAARRPTKVQARIGRMHPRDLVEMTFSHDRSRRRGHSPRSTFRAHAAGSPKENCLLNQSAHEGLRRQLHQHMQVTPN